MDKEMDPHEIFGHADADTSLLIAFVKAKEGTPLEMALARGLLAALAGVGRLAEEWQQLQKEGVYNGHDARHGVTGPRAAALD